MGNAASSQELVLEEAPGSGGADSQLERLFDRLRNDELFGCTLAKDLGRLTRQLAKAGAAERREASQGFGLAHVCCLLRWTEGLEKALQAGANIDLASRSGYTPLHLAAFRGAADCVRVLLAAGARPELRSRRGSTATHFAAQQPCTAVLEQVLAHPARGNVDDPGFRSRTPLHLAVLAHGDPGILKLLIDAGADVSTINRVLHGITPLHTAAHHGRVEALKQLLEAGGNPNTMTEDNISPLLEVFAHPGLGHDEEDLRTMFTLLRDAGADVNVTVPRQGYSLLHFALTTCNEESTVELLLDSGVNPGANVNRPLTLFDPRSKSTMLHKAAKRGWPSVVRRLVAAGADMTLRDRDGLNPLHVAVIYKQDAVVEALLAAGAAPRARGPNCYPSFSRWKMNRGMQAIQAMMEGAENGNGGLAHLIAPPAEELPAVDMACCVSQHIPTVEAFLRHGARPSAEALALAAEDTPIMRTVVERPPWTPELHARWPAKFKRYTRELLRCLRRATATACVELPATVIGDIIHQAAYPISYWAEGDTLWHARQRVRQPGEGQAAPGDAAAQPAAAPAAPPAGGPPGLAALGIAELMGHVMQQLQQGIADALGHAHGEEDDSEDEEEAEDAAHAQPAGAQGQQPAAAAGAAAAAAPPPPPPANPLAGLLGGLPPGLPPPNVVQQQQLGPNMQLVQLEFNVPLHQLLGAAGNAHGLAGLPPLGLAPPGLANALAPPPGFAGPFIFQGGLPGLFPFMAGPEDDDDEEEGGGDWELGEMELDPLLHPLQLPPHQPAAPQVPQQAPQAGPAAGAGAGPSGAGAGAPVPPPEDESSEDEDAPGPSTRAGRKRRASAGDSGGNGSGRYNLRPRNKKQKKD